MDNDVKNRLAEKYGNSHLFSVFAWLYKEMHIRIPEISFRVQQRYIGVYSGNYSRSILAYIDLQETNIHIGVKEVVFDSLNLFQLRKESFPDWNRSQNLIGVRLSRDTPEVIELLEACYLEKTKGLKFITPISPILEEDDEAVFPEGKEVYYLHRSKERNSKLVKKAKQIRLHHDPLLKCDVCGFSYKIKYGDLGNGFIEAHHITPLSELHHKVESKIEDLALVCSSCHRMLHRKRPWISSIDKLKSLLVTR